MCVYFTSVQEPLQNKIPYFKPLSTVTNTDTKYDDERQNSEYVCERYFSPPAGCRHCCLCPLPHQADPDLDDTHEKAKLIG